MENVLNDATRIALPSKAVSIAEFDEVVRRHQKRVYRVLFVLLRDPDEADSLTQECFLRAYQNLDRFRGECSVQTWLMRIAVNLVRDHERNRKMGFWKRLLGFSNGDVQAKALEFPAPGPSPEQSLIARAQVQAVWEAVRGLSPQQRTIFALRFVEELELSEIAGILGLQTGSVKTQLFRSVHTVRRKLKEQKWR
jgi:RNA polymerase sigma-70 factor (ECF subfamily)